MSNDQRFSEEELASLAKWNNLEDFQEAASGKPRILTVDEIEVIQQQAYDEAFAQGKKDGWQEGYDKGYSEGKESGHQQGFKEGAEQGYQEKSHTLKQQCATFISMIDTLQEPFKNLDASVEEELVELAIGIARQLLRREIKIEPGQVIAVVKAAVKALPVAHQHISLTLHPEDAELVRTTLELDEMSPPWKINEDPLMTRGGCIVDSGASHVDASVEKRLNAIINNIMGGERKSDRSA